MELLALVLPQNAFVVVESTFTDVIETQRGGLLSIGFLSAWFFATNGIHALLRAFNQSAFYQETRTWLQQRWVAFKLTLIVSIALIAAITVLVLGEYLVGVIKTDLHLQSSVFWIYVVLCSRWVVFIFSYWITVSLLYRYAPSVDSKWPILNIGSFLATLLAVVSSIGFSLYINYYNTYNKIYGSIGTLIVVMIWLYLNSLILLVGFEMNARYFHLRKRVKLKKNTPENSFKVVENVISNFN